MILDSRLPVTKSVVYLLWYKALRNDSPELSGRPKAGAGPLKQEFFDD